jgi:hypothetical protein
MISRNKRLTKQLEIQARSVAGIGRQVSANCASDGTRVIDCASDSVSGLHLTEDRINPKSATAIFETLLGLLKYIDDKDRVAV